MGHVALQRSAVPDGREHGRQGIAEIGEQAPLGERRQLIEGGRAGGDGQHPLRGGGRDRAAPHARLDQSQVKFGPPGQLPALPERPDVRCPALPRRTPGHFEQGQPVQQAAAGQVVRLAQVQVIIPGRCLGPQPQVTLLVLQVPLERHHGGGGRHRSEPLADHELPLDERGEQVAALAEHRTGRLGDLFQAGQRPSAQRGERLGQPYGFDHVRRRRRDALVAQDGGGLGQPPLDGLARGAEQVVVPAGGADAGPVARGIGQPPVGPGHPGQGGLHLRQAAQQPVIGGRGRQVAERRYVPGTADHRDPLEAVPDRPAQHFPHMRLADRVARVGFLGVDAEDPDGFGQGIEDRTWVRTGKVLHHILPPALRVVVPGRGGQFADGIGARLWCIPTHLPSPLHWHRKLVGGWQVAEPHRDARAQRVPDRLPLRREHRERPERRLLWLAGHVPEQRHRRPHLFIRRQGDQPVRFRRPLDQHHVRALFL